MSDHPDTFPTPEEVGLKRGHDDHAGEEIADAIRERDRLWREHVVVLVAAAELRGVEPMTRPAWDRTDVDLSRAPVPVPVRNIDLKPGEVLRTTMSTTEVK